MKGIRKLFLGIILVTLFGVGFRVEVKAVTTHIKHVDASSSDWSNSSAGIRGYIHIKDSDFESDNTVTFECKMMAYKEEDSDITTLYQIGDTATIVLTDAGAGGKTVTVNNLSITYSSEMDVYFPVEEDSDNPGTAKTITLGKDRIRKDILKYYGNPSTKNENVLAIATKGNTKIMSTSSSDYKSVLVPLAKVEGGAFTYEKVGDIKKEKTYEETDPTLPVYMFPNESFSFYSGEITATYNYYLDRWTTTGGTLTDADKEKCQLTMGGTFSDDSNITLNKNYGAIVLSDVLYGTAAARTNKVTFKLGSDLKGSDITGCVIKKGDTSINVPTYTFDPNTVQTGQFDLVIPSGTAVGTYDIIFTAKGHQYTNPSKLVVYGGSDVALTGAVVYVNNGLSVNLNEFTDDNRSTSTFIKSVTMNAPANGYASVTPPGPEFLQYVKVTGDLPTSNVNASTGVASITMTNMSGSSTSKNVTVYPSPTLKEGSNKLTITMPYGVYYNNIKIPELSKAVLEFKGSDGTEVSDSFSMGTADTNKLYTTKEISLSKSDDIDLNSILKKVCKGESDTVYVKAYAYYNSNKDNNIVSNEDSFTAYRINLEGNATFTVDGQEMSGYFYAPKGSSHTVAISGSGTLDKNNSSPEFANSTSVTLSGVAGARTLKANYTGNSSSMPSSSTPTTGRSAGEMDDYDDVPKTGESKADIWILWSVLFIAIIGAGFVIWKRFGLVRAIAEADEEIAAAEQTEKVEAEKKEKEDKIRMLKDLRNLK